MAQQQSTPDEVPSIKELRKRRDEVAEFLASMAEDLRNLAGDPPEPLVQAVELNELANAAELAGDRVKTMLEVQ